MLGALEKDDHLESTMEEAAQIRTPAGIRKFFATLIRTCGLSNQTEMWKKYKDVLTEDILKRFQQSYSNLVFNDNI